MVEDDQMDPDFRMYVDSEFRPGEMSEALRPKFGLARKINSSRGTRMTPNVYIKDLCFYALRDILPGEELLASYDFNRSAPKQSKSSLKKCPPLPISTPSSQASGLIASPSHVVKLLDFPAMSITARDIILQPLYQPTASEASTTISFSSGLTIRSIEKSKYEMHEALMACVPFGYIAGLVPALQGLVKAGNSAAGCILLREELGKYIHRFRPTESELRWLRADNNAVKPELSWSSFAELCQHPGQFLGDLGWQVAADFFCVSVTFWRRKQGGIMFHRRLLPSVGRAHHSVNVVETTGQNLVVDSRQKLTVVPAWGNVCPSAWLPVTRRRGLLAVLSEQAQNWQRHIVETRRARPRTASSADVENGTPPMTLLNAYVNIQAILWDKVKVPPHGTTSTCSVQIRLKENEDVVDAFFACCCDGSSDGSCWGSSNGSCAGGSPPSSLVDGGPGKWVWCCA